MPRTRIQPRAAAVTLVVLGLLTFACTPGRPDFDSEKALQDLARALERPERELAIYADEPVKPEEGGISTGPKYWIVDFRLDDHAEWLQARFHAGETEWMLQDLRERPRKGEDTEWQPVGVLAGELRRAASEDAQRTMETMEELGGFIEAYAATHGNLYPTTPIEGLKALLTDGGYTRDWRHDTDAWGNRLVYHASPDGQSYILVSPGSGGQLDRPKQEYVENTNRGLLRYDGLSSDPEQDIIYGNGTFAQSYVPPE